MNYDISKPSSKNMNCNLEINLGIGYRNKNIHNKDFFGNSR